MALVASGSKVEVTASDLEAEVGIQAEKSELDLAGMMVRGRRAAVLATRPISVLFSVSRIESRHVRGFVHGVRELDHDGEL